MSSTLSSFARTIHRQHGEEGIISEIIKRLQLSPDWYVDIGAWDGIHLSNAYFLLDRGWQGIGLEGDPDKYEDLKTTCLKHQGKLHPLLAQVQSAGPYELTNILSKTSLPFDFGILNIDIDSHDWWIWHNLADYYRPKLVIIEINSTIPVGITYVQPADASVPVSGASFTSTLQLGQAKGYQLVAHTGNLIFVRNDLVPKLHLSPTELANPDAMFNNEWLIRKYVNKQNLFQASKIFIRDRFRKYIIS